MKIKIVLLFCLVVLPFYTTLYAQYPYYKNYTINDGLASNKIYNIIEDRSGFVWICTDQGVSRFDGVSFVNFTTKDGLPDNDVLNLFEDNKGRIWFNGFSTEPCYYQNGKVFNSENDSLLSRIRKFKPRGMCLSVILQHNNSIAFCIEEKGRRFFVGKETEDIEFKKKSGIYPIFRHILIRKNNSFESYSYLEKFKWKGGDSPQLVTFQFNPCKLNYTRSPYKYIYWLNLKTNSVVQANIENNDSTDFRLSRKYNNIFPCNGFVALSADSLYTLYNNEMTSEIETVKLPFNYETILVDLKGNKWFGSFDNGLFFIRQNRPIMVSLPQNKEKGILSLWPSGGLLLLGTETNGLLFVDSMGCFSKAIKTSDINRIKGLGSNADYQILGVDNGLYISRKDFSGLRIFQSVAVKDIEMSENREVLVGTASFSAVFKYKGRDTLIMLDKYRTTAICRSNASEIWIGGLSGIRKCREGLTGYKSSELKLNTLIDNSRIVDIKKDKNGNMWVATDQKGLFFCPQSGEIVHFSEDARSSHMLMSDACFQIVIASDNGIWLATRGGVSVIRYPAFNQSEFTVANYSIPEGIPGKTVNSLAFWQNKIAIATTNGLFYFDKWPEPSNETNVTLVTRIRVNNMVREQSDLELPYDQNNLIISYASSFINTGMAYDFRYRIKELNENWTRTNTLEVPLLGLEPGKYTFEIAAINSHGFSGKVTTLNFEILKPWFKQWWFNALITIIVILYAFYYYRLIREKITMGKNLTLLRLRILRAQMNPHFVFNALNNIQHLIQIKQLENADVYIGTLASIMRKSIDYSAKEFIQLDKEIEYTRNYLEIEKLRFQDKFDFTFEVSLSSEDQQAFFVPPLIIQPIVENAIKHAFRGIGHKGNLSIIISKLRDNKLRYTISDNGCGFDVTTIQPVNHGLDITWERLEILYKGLNKKSTFIMESNSKPPVTGTKITIDLPIIKD